MVPEMPGRNGRTRLLAWSHIAHDQVACTLYEGDFHLGVAVWMNSLLRRGFRGLFWVGHRGELPEWTRSLKRRPDGLFEIGEALLGFETIEVSRHFGQFKPEFMNHIIDLGIARQWLWYFDPDITVRCRWDFFERWIGHGVCLCQEINMGSMAFNHPLRCEWVRLARQAGWGEPLRQLDSYYNSGFLGLHVSRRRFLDRWQTSVKLANSAGVPHDQFQVGTRAQTFYTVDQDTMNIATMYSEEPLATMGPEGMGWLTGGFTMYHTLGKQKPWRKQFLRAALSGDPPGVGDRHFLENASGPIRPYGVRELASLRIRARIAAMAGRFYRRGR